MEFDVTIGITSYNRVNELTRCLESIDASKYRIEILVSEDHSPKREAIEKAVEQFANKSSYTIVFNSNEHNLGYDRNLGKIISLANGKYILLMSDDDCFIPGTLDGFIESVIESKASLGYAAFKIAHEHIMSRKYVRSFIISSGQNSVRKYFLDSILFSGLMFKKEEVVMYSAERFLNHYYFQVYIFLNVLYDHGAYYHSIPVVWCVCDGENAYGISESSEKNADLADRKSVFSNIEFNNGLIKVIRIFDNERKTDIIKSFEKAYSFRAYMGMSKAKRAGKEIYYKYWLSLKSLDINLRFWAYAYNLMLRVFGCKISDKIMLYLRKMAIERVQSREIG